MRNASVMYKNVVLIIEILKQLSTVIDITMKIFESTGLARDFNLDIPDI